MNTHPCFLLCFGPGLALMMTSSHGSDLFWKSFRYAFYISTLSSLTREGEGGEGGSDLITKICTLHPWGVCDPMSYIDILDSAGCRGYCTIYT